MKIRPTKSNGLQPHDFPRKAWKQVRIEAADTLTLFGAKNRGYLQVDLINDSSVALETGPGMEFAFAFKLLSSAGKVLDLESVRTGLSASVAPGSKHTQKITVIIYH